MEVQINTATIYYIEITSNKKNITIHYIISLWNLGPYFLKKMILLEKETFKKRTFLSAFKICIYIARKDSTLKIHIVRQNAYKTLSAGIESYAIPLGFSGQKKLWYITYCHI